MGPPIGSTHFDPTRPDPFATPTANAVGLTHTNARLKGLFLTRIYGIHVW